MSTKDGIQIHKDYDADGNWVGGFERPIPNKIIETKVTVPVYAPTGGLYYHCGYTNAPPYIKPGETIQTRDSRVVALMQVENTFVELTCPIMDATFLRHLVGNGDAVKGGQAIYEVEVLHIITDLEKEPGNTDWWLDLASPDFNKIVLPGSINKAELEAFIDVISAGLKKNATGRTVDLHVTFLLVKLKTHGRVDLDLVKQEVISLQGRLFNEDAWHRAVRHFRQILAELDHAGEPATDPGATSI